MTQNTTRIAIFPRHTDAIPDTRGQHLAHALAEQWHVRAVNVVDVYTIDYPLDDQQTQIITDSLHNPVSQTTAPITGFDYALEIGFLPGVTDNVATTTREIIEDALGIEFADEQGVYSSKLYLISGDVTKEDVKAIANELSNPLIERAHMKSAAQYALDSGMDTIVPQVHLDAYGKADEVNLGVSDEELVTIGQRGIPNADGTYRGPLGLTLPYMKAIQQHFQSIGRNPTDIELETLAQTWSEHCKHTIFANPIDEIKDGLYKHYIKRATQDVRKAKGEDDFCVSVFTDNSGAITFDDEWLVTDKAETHNSPSALDPFGGAITGIVGVNRDTMGFGQGAKPVLNRYGYCFSDPRVDVPLYKDKAQTHKMLSSRYIMEGVVEGVNVGGNCSGVPSPQGFAYFDDRYRGKPLVFAGTVGLIPREINGKPSHIKCAQPGDTIVMVGGRVGKDGIHGATFSSVALDEGSPATAVQIGDPITQKKMSDALIKEARDQGLYHAITDNGAGGLSSSVGEMAEGSGGFVLELDKVPLKYPGMEPWEIWISESQERMTLAIPPENVETFIALMARRDVEATAIGTFTDSGQAVINWHGEAIMDVSMDFLHDGLPKLEQLTEEVPVPHHEVFPILSSRRKPGSITGRQNHQEIPASARMTDILPALLSSLNICSKEFIATQYDHEVQGISVLKPMQGKGRVFSEGVVSRPVLLSQKGIVTSQGIVPRYSDIDTYHMAACAIDTAIRNAVAVGANPDHMAIMDNFCWCSSDDPRRLYQLKRTAEACYDYATAFGTPFISGKDSMFNDFKGYDADGNPIHIAIPPTLLVSTLSVIPDIHHIASLDLKQPGDVVYLVGELKGELGGSEYNHLHGTIGEDVPTVEAASALARYRAMYQAIQQGLIASAIPVGLGGAAVALAKTAIGGQLGLDISLPDTSANILYGESQSCFIVSVAPEKASEFEDMLSSSALTRLGEVTDGDTLTFNGESLPLDTLTHAYKHPLADY